MKIKILESAKEDLKEGFHFYEFQERGIGKYFLEALSVDEIEISPWHFEAVLTTITRNLRTEKKITA